VANSRIYKIGLILGILNGLYVVFLIGLAMGGFGERLDYSYMVTINEAASYFGSTNIFPLVVCAFILVPLIVYAPIFVAGRKKGKTPKS
jgi:hypothetical protein